MPRNKIIINDEFFTLLDSIFEKLGLSKKDLAKEHFINKINSIQGNKKAIIKEQQFIKGKIDALKKEIAQYENNISFFATGQNTKPLLKKAQKQIDNARNKINELKEKLQLLNKA